MGDLILANLSFRMKGSYVLNQCFKMGTEVMPTEGGITIEKAFSDKNSSVEIKVTGGTIFAAIAVWFKEALKNFHHEEAECVFASMAVAMDGVRHNMNGVFEVGKDILPGIKKTFRIKKAAPNYLHGSTDEIEAEGNSIPAAIAAWFGTVREYAANH